MRRSSSTGGSSGERGYSLPASRRRFHIARLTPSRAGALNVRTTLPEASAISILTFGAFSSFSASFFSSALFSSGGVWTARARAASSRSAASRFSTRSFSLRSRSFSSSWSGRPGRFSE